MMARSHEEVRESTMPAVAESAGEIVFQGIAAAPGIAIGPAYVYARESQDNVERRSIGDDFEAEIARFESAVERSEHDLKKIASVAGEKLGKDSAAIFDALAMMLRDERLYDAVIAEIRDHRVNADYAVQEVMTGHRQMMKASDSEYLRERAADLLDLQDRLIRHLRHGKLLSAIEPNCIVIAESVTASDIVLFSRRGILGVGMEFGGPTSHVALMARALDVPAVVSLHDVVDYVNDGDTVILDGISGRLIVRPSAEVLERHERRRERYQRLRLEQEELAGDPTRTLDGVDVQLMANIEFEEELRLMKAYGADGIGLFRTEIMVLLQQSLAIAEDEQYRIYSKIVSETAPKPTVIRVLDLGGDKILPMGAREQNPFLGWRGIRLLLDKPEMLIPQLRAILRASHLGPVKILLPMVTNLEEVALFREVLKRVEDTPKGPRLILSRSDALFVQALFRLEVPEIQQGIVEIKAAAREVGSRTKIAVTSRDEAVDAVGACVGLKGARVQAVVNELGGERIDIIPWSPDPERFAKLALAPAKVARVFSDEASRTIQAVVDEDQLSLAIGRNGQNVRLASELTEWKIDLYSSREWLEKGGEAPLFAPLPEEGDVMSDIPLNEIQGLDVATVAVLAEAGFRTLDDILDLDRDDLLRLPGIAPEEADRIMAIIDELTMEDDGDSAGGGESE